MEDINDDGYDATFFYNIIESDMYMTDSVKWYTHEQDMKSLSRRYPNKVFRLEGEGEDNGDKWVKYFQSGMIQRERQPPWTPPPFNPRALTL